MQLVTHLKFDGDCRAAFECYATLLGGRIVAMTRFADAPDCEHAALSPGTRDRIMHARLEAGGHVLMGSDATPDYPYHGVVGAHVVVDMAEPADAERLFAALAIEGHVELALQPTPWARRYGIVIDRFGVPWMVNCSAAVGSRARAAAREVA